MWSYNYCRKKLKEDEDISGIGKEFKIYFGRYPNSDKDNQFVNDIFKVMTESIAVWEEIMSEEDISKNQWNEIYEQIHFYKYANKLIGRINERQNLLITYLNSIGISRLMREEQKKMKSAIIKGVELGGTYTLDDFQWILTTQEIEIERQAWFIETLQHERVHMLKADDIGLFVYDVPHATSIGLLTAHYCLQRFRQTSSRWEEAKQIYYRYSMNDHPSEHWLCSQIAEMQEKYNKIGEVEQSYIDGQFLAVATSKFFEAYTEHPTLAGILLFEFLGIGEKWEVALNKSIIQANDPDFRATIHGEMDGTMRQGDVAMPMADIAPTIASMYHRAYGNDEYVAGAVINHTDRIVVPPRDPNSGARAIIPRYQWRKAPLV